MTSTSPGAIPPVISLAVVFGRKMRGNSRVTQDKLAETGIIVVTRDYSLFENPVTMDYFTSE